MAGLPYKIATLLYCFSPQDEVLLLERAQEPNLGLWSPCGGKLDTDVGESPDACACREAGEELGVVVSAGELHLTGLVSEDGYQGQSHWLMFLFEVTCKLTTVPAPHREGRFQFFTRAALDGLALPQRTVNASGPGSGSTGAASSPRIVIVLPMARTRGLWKNPGG